MSDIDTKKLRETCQAVVDARRDGHSLFTGERSRAQAEFRRTVGAEHVLALLDRIDALEGEVKESKRKQDTLHALVAQDAQARDRIRTNWVNEEREWLVEKARLEAKLAAVTAARDEACDIADALSNYIAVGNPYAKVAERQARIAQLRTAGTKEQT